VALATYCRYAAVVRTRLRQVRASAARAGTIRIASGLKSTYTVDNRPFASGPAATGIASGLKSTYTVDNLPFAPRPVAGSASKPPDGAALGAAA
jgi:orotate phosphoribosyltransferase